MTTLVIKTDSPICLACRRKLTDEEMNELEEVPFRDHKVLKGSCPEGHAIFIHLPPAKTED